ncbi:MAG TPA: hypothetical protein VFI24_24775 [Pyrinomonadaceae bacterium]|nr:hypothetical protein [Pyrinomonadaceae bacterium]
MLNSIKQALKKTIPDDVIKFRRDLEARRAWEKQGRPSPPPHIVKEELIRDYATKFNTRVLIETGTYLGDMVHAMKKSFARIVSFELDQQLAAQARARFAGESHIEIIQGDSGRLLGDLLKTIEEPCLFWLDGHYSGGITAKGALETPIKNELNFILSHPVKNHVILVDDARCFTGENDYPTIDELQNLVHEQNPGLKFSVEHDAIRIHPA